MTVASEITKLQSNLSDCYTAVFDKGGTLPEHENFDNLATAISSIEGGGGSGDSAIVEVGSLTIAGTVVSGFSTSNYFQTNKTFPESSGFSTWEFGIKITTENLSGTQFFISDTVGGSGNVIGIGSSKLLWYAANTNSFASWNILGGVAGTTTLSANTTYWIKAVFDGSSYKCYLSTTGEFAGEETTEISVSNSTKIYGGNPISYGVQVLSAGFKAAPFAGSIDLADTYIKIDGNVWWTGVSDTPVPTPSIESLSITPTTSAQTYTASGTTRGYSPVEVSAVTASIDNNIVAGNIRNGVSILGVTGTYGTPPSKYQLLQRITDDSNNEIGTVSGFFTDGNDVEYAVVCLDAQYRGTNKTVCSEYGIVTNMPLNTDWVSSDWRTDTLSATDRCQLIEDYCTANSYTSDAVDFCRNQSFTIDGVSYQGQLPNGIELNDIIKNSTSINSLDTSASSYSSLSFATSKGCWSSNQYNANYFYYVSAYGSYEIYNLKTAGYFVIPVLELPNAL